MRFDTKVALGLFSVALMGFGNVAFADEIDDALGDTATSSADSSSTTPVINKPIFSVSISLSHCRCNDTQANYVISRHNSL